MAVTDCKDGGDSCTPLVHENGFQAFPEKAGLYDPANEKDSCGVGFVVNIKGKATHDTVRDALTILEHMEHRGATGEEENTGMERRSKGRDGFVEKGNEYRRQT